MSFESAILRRRELDGLPAEARKAEIEEILDLRHRILRPGFPPADALFDGDRDPLTLHFGVFRDGKNLCCASLMQAPVDGQPAWQLRGMATDEPWQGHGLGAMLLGAIGDFLRVKRDRRPVWCNAREKAVAFYSRHGWKTCSDKFDIPTVGPHFRMLWENR